MLRFNAGGARSRADSIRLRDSAALLSDDVTRSYRRIYRQTANSVIISSSLAHLGDPIMPDKYIPQALGPFQEYTANFIRVVSAAPTDFGLTTAKVTPLSDSFAAYNAKRDAYNNAKSVLDGAAKGQEDARDDTIVVLREVAQFIQTRKETTDEQRGELHLPIHKDGRTPVPPPASIPNLRVEVERGGRHEVVFSDAATPDRDRKPEGVMGCEIHEFILEPGATAPSDYASWPLVGIDTHNPYLRIHPPEHVGKDAIYVGRWLNAKGEPGPWGQSSAPQTVTR